MDSNATALLMRADIRHRELQVEAARLHLARRASDDTPTLRAAMAMAYRRLQATLAAALQQREAIKWTVSLTWRGALPR